MKQVIDNSGRKIKGLFKKDDGSLVVVDPIGLRKSQTITNHMIEQENTIINLQAQVTKILEKLNGIHKI